MLVQIGYFKFLSARTSESQLETIAEKNCSFLTGIRITTIFIAITNQYTSIRKKSKESQVIIPGYAPEAQ